MNFNPNEIDVFGVRNDGGADLVIVADGALDDSEETQKALLDKIENYLAYINSGDFRKECPKSAPENTRVILRLSEKPPQLISELLEKVVPWAADCGATFCVRVENKN